MRAYALISKHMRLYRASKGLAVPVDAAGEAPDPRQMHDEGGAARRRRSFTAALT